ncbi:hypothetical protein [Methylobacterium sp. GC_Met_2]|uniref:hypothetical protein n=1 Tax=Methylobacterium sp. GC_Met_2 TaxID=2937376 RepID=UPI00226BAEC2|nr:hypothetical protein [Methylobacterium sp. GC_Met_2]
MGNPIEDDPELAAAVGRVASYWAHLEHHFASLFGALTGLDMTMAVTVFSYFRSARTQRDVILSSAKVSSRSEEKTFDRIKQVLSEYDRLAAVRNAIVHTPFGYETEGKNLYRMERERVSQPGVFPYKKTPFTIQEVEGLLEPIKELIGNLRSLNLYIIEKPLRDAGVSMPDRLGD